MNRKRTGIGIAAVGILVAAGLRGNVRRYAIAEHSMVPELEPGDWVLAVRTSSPPDRGAVVVFPHPEGTGLDLVKRVVGLPGEHVEIAGGQVHVDGRTLAEPWAEGPTLPDGSWVVADDEVFVLGDQRALSFGDSRTIGPIPVAATSWRVRFRYWPATRVGRV